MDDTSETQEVTIPLESQDWYVNLIEDCKNIILTKEFNARWELIEAYHELGKLLLENNSNFERSKIYGLEIVKKVAISIGRSERTVEKAIQFAKQFPDLSLLREGNDVTWNKICNKYLVSPRSEVPLTVPSIEELARIIQSNAETLAEHSMPKQGGINIRIPWSVVYPSSE